MDYFNSSNGWTISTSVNNIPTDMNSIPVPPRPEPPPIPERPLIFQRPSIPVQPSAPQSIDHNNRTLITTTDNQPIIQHQEGTLIDSNGENHQYSVDNQFYADDQRLEYRSDRTSVQISTDQTTHQSQSFVCQF